jgi:PAS domain S-box-containing protein
MYLDIILNLSLLIALTIISTFFERRKSSKTKSGALLQGILFGSVAIIGMLKPAVYEPGVIFDGRSVLLSLCGLFFDVYAVVPAMVISILARVFLGGDGVSTGILTILFSSLAGLYYRRLRKGDLTSITTEELLGFGFITHFGVLLILSTLKVNNLADALKTLTIPYLLFFPLASLLAGKILLENHQIIEYITKLNSLNSKQKATFESIAEGIIVTDSESKITELNQSAEELIGIDREHINGKNILDVIKTSNKEILEKIEKGLNSALKDGNNTSINNIAFISNKGSEHYLNINISPLKNEDDVTIGVVFTLYDRTQEKVAEHALMESEKRYKTFLDTCPLMIWTTDAQKSFDYFNPQWIKFRGRKLEEELSMGWFNGMHPEDVEYFIHIFSDAFEKRNSCSLVYRLKNSNSEYRWINNYCYPRYNSDGKFAGYIGFAIDITEIKQTQEKVDLLLKALETIKYGVIICNKKMQIEWVNPAFTEIMGYSLNEIQGKNPNDVVRSFLNSSEFYDSIEKTIINGNIWHGEIIDRRKNGDIC